MDILYISNDNLIELQSLTDATDDSVITDATVTVTLVDSAGSSVSGGSWPLSMSHVATGTYRATLADTLTLSANRAYTAQITATTTGGVKGYWELPLKSMVRM